MGDMKTPLAAVSEKSRIIGALGEKQLLLPSLLNGALAANDRIKYYLSLLQSARRHAEHPEEPAVSLRAERNASGVAESAFDEVAASGSKQSDKDYRIAHSGEICEAVLRDAGEMLAPLAAAARDGAAEFAARLERLREQIGRPRDNLMSAEQIALLAAGGRDSLHRLVMDAHKALNRLQQEISTETLNGARVYDIAAGDRPLIQAFMRGVNRTAPLKFDHPGLGTTATRAGSKLIIQNDIGTTDAHVLVVHVEGATVTATYTDVHLQRLLFFQGLFEGRNVGWEDMRSKKDEAVEGGVYHLCLGTFAAPDQSELEEFLAFLGSRLVFLIDWNRARKRLRNFVPKRDCIALLHWAAEHDHGHMAFLKAGGEQIIYDALEFVVSGPYRFGTQLHEMLGVDKARSYLKFVLKTAAEGLLHGRPESLIRDEARAELFNYFRSAEQNLLDIAARHAALITEIAGAVRDGLAQLHVPQRATRAARNAARAKQWEKQADDLLNETRAAVRRDKEAEFFGKLLGAADDIADELEDAAFHLTLLQWDKAQAELEKPLCDLSELVVQGAQEYLKALETVRFIHRGAAREDTQDFLESIHRIVAIEHQTDDLHRTAEAALATSSVDFRQLHLIARTADNLEQAADALLHTGLTLRDHVLDKVIAA